MNIRMSFFLVPAIQFLCRKRIVFACPPFALPFLVSQLSQVLLCQSSRLQICYEVPFEQTVPQVLFQRLHKLQHPLLSRQLDQIVSRPQRSRPLQALRHLPRLLEALLLRLPKVHHLLSAKLAVVAASSVAKKAVILFLRVSGDRSTRAIKLRSAKSSKTANADGLRRHSLRVA